MTATGGKGWVRRLSLAAMAAAVLGCSGCGFRPLYGTPKPDATPLSSDLAAIDVALIPDRSGQQLRNELEQLLNPGARTGVADRYTLSVQLREKLDTFAVERSGFASRATIELTASYSLQEDAAGSQVLAGRARSISSYNLLDNDFSTVAGADDARRRAIQQLAYEIRNRLAAHFAAPRDVAAGGSEGATGPEEEPLSEGPAGPGGPVPVMGE